MGRRSLAVCYYCITYLVARPPSQTFCSVATLCVFSGQIWLWGQARGGHHTPSRHLTCCARSILSGTLTNNHENAAFGSSHAIPYYDMIWTLTSSLSIAVRGIKVLLPKTSLNAAELQVLTFNARGPVTTSDLGSHLARLGIFTIPTQPSYDQGATAVCNVDKITQVPWHWKTDSIGLSTVLHGSMMDGRSCTSPKSSTICATAARAPYLLAQQQSTSQYQFPSFHLNINILVCSSLLKLAPTVSLPLSSGVQAPFLNCVSDPAEKPNALSQKLRVCALCTHTQPRM